jgi:hypothetical protein
MRRKSGSLVVKVSVQLPGHSVQAMTISLFSSVFFLC